jgi:hypothetical protein
LQRRRPPGFSGIRDLRLSPAAGPPRS